MTSPIPTRFFEQVRFSVDDQIGADRRVRLPWWIRANQGYSRTNSKKIFQLWGPDGEGEWGYQVTPFYRDHQAWFRGIRIVNQVFYVTMLLMFLAATRTLWLVRAKPVAYIGIAVVAIVTVTSVVFSGQSRYHFPAMPFILAYAAWFLVRRGAHG
jgi:hypothetical protein